MAQWPIVRTQRTMPGTATGGFRGSLNYPDDAIREWEKFAANMKDLSKDFADEFKRRRLQRIADQTDEFKLRYAEEQEKFSVALSNEQDPEKYPAMYEKFNNNVSSSFMPKDPLAAQAARFYVRAKDIPNRKFIRGLQTAKYKDRWFGRYGALKVDVEQGTRTLNELTFMQMEGKNLGYIGEEQAGDDFRETKKIADYKRWSNIAKVEPEKVINSIEIKDGKKVIGYIPDLKDTGDIEAIESIAEGRYFDIIARRKRISLDTRTKINEKADDPNFSSIEFEEEVTKAVDMHEITPEQGDTMRGVWKEARKTVSEGNPNPYTTTSNWDLYTEHRKRAANRTITEQEIMDNAGSTEGYSWPEAEKLLRVINGKDSSSKAFEDSAAAENLKKIIGDTIGDDVSLNQFATQRGMGLLEDAIQSHPDWTDREKKEEALRVGRRIEREYDDGLLETELERTIEITTEQRAEAIEKDLNKIDLSEIKKYSRKRKGITKAEFDKLPSGAVFLAPDGKRRRKP